MKVIVHTDHTIPKYLMVEKDAKSRLIHWVLFVKKFYFEVKDPKGIENQVADHLLWLKEEAMLKLKNKIEIDDTFLVEQI